MTIFKRTSEKNVARMGKLGVMSSLIRNSLMSCFLNSIVERVVIHVIDPPPAELSEAVRVFVVFSGLAGAWQTVKKMDDRLFGGRHVVSRRRCRLALVLALTLAEPVSACHILQ
jgi:hypothetical protein